MTRRFGPAARALLAAITLTLTGFMASVVPAAATPEEPSEDSRATLYSDDNASTCKDAGLAGVIIEKDQIDFETDESNIFLNITDVPSDVELTGIVVKGGNAYNVYSPDQRDDLRSPLNGGGNIPQISHWFACGQQSNQTGGTGDETGDEAGDEVDNASTEGSETDEADDVASANTDAEGNSTSPGDVSSGDRDTELANTGVSGSATLLILGCGLLVVGAGLVFGIRATRRRGDSSTG